MWTALALVYLVWGTTYLGIRIAIQTIPPFMMAGTRYLIAGGTLVGFLRWRGAAWPTRNGWISATLVGILMWTIGNGGVTLAERWVASGLSAVIVASVPLWAALFVGFWDDWPRRREWAGLALGAGGVLLLSFGADLRATPIGAVILVFSAASFALGSVWSHHLPLPAGLMGTGACMATGGVFLLLLSVVRGEHLVAVPSTPSLLAVAYLIVFGAMIGAGAYGFLLQHVRPAVATSYAFVNPVIAVIAGNVVANERVSPGEVAAMATILVAVALVLSGRGRLNANDASHSPHASHADRPVGPQGLRRELQGSIGKSMAR